MTDRRLVAVVGPTAAGKSALAVALTKRFGGGIVNADSRQVYRGMDIGTAKPSPADQATVPHYLYDIADPTDGFSLALYLRHARATLDAIWSAGRTPWVVGGTGQYVWALLEAWTVPEVAPDLGLRAELRAVADTEGAEALHARLALVDPVAAVRIEAPNVRRVIRALEVYHRTGRPISEWQRKGDPGFAFRVLGVDQADDILQSRIEDRVRDMYEAGFVAEAGGLLEAGLTLDSPAMSAIGYREAAQVAIGELTQVEAVEQTVAATRRLVRRQRQWFRKTDDRIKWGSSMDDFEPAVEAILAAGR
jgi:tRNA dimethylallyltransferase